MTKREITKIEKFNRAVQDLVWKLSLATFSQFDQMKREAASNGLRSHEQLFLLATTYLGHLSISKPEHAEAIPTLGDAISFAASLAGSKE